MYVCACITSGLDSTKEQDDEYNIPYSGYFSGGNLSVRSEYLASINIVVIVYQYTICGNTLIICGLPIYYENHENIAPWTIPALQYISTKASTVLEDKRLHFPILHILF